MAEEWLVPEPNRRMYVRIRLASGIKASIRIVWVSASGVRSSPGTVLLLDLSPGGCGFVSALLFPAAPGIGLEIEWDAGRNRMRIAGQIVWSRREGNLYRHGMRFLEMSVRDRVHLLQELGRLLIEQCPGQSKIHMLYRDQCGRCLTQMTAEEKIRGEVLWNEHSEG
jgi:Predicted glycosyltransferase